MGTGFLLRHKTLRATGALNPVATIAITSRPYLTTRVIWGPTLSKSGKTIKQGEVLSEEIIPSPQRCVTCGIVHVYKTYHLSLNHNGELLVSNGVLESLGEAGAIQLNTPGAIAAADPVFDFIGEDGSPPDTNLASANAQFSQPDAPRMHVDLSESDGAQLRRKARIQNRLALRAEQRDVDPAVRSLLIRPDGTEGQIVGVNRNYDNYANNMLGNGVHTLPDWDTDNIRAMLMDESDITLNTTTMQDLADTVAALVAESANLTVAAPSGGAVDVTDYTFTSVSGDAADSLHYFHETGTDSTSSMMSDIDTATGLPVTPNGGNIDVTVHASGALGLVS